MAETGIKEASPATEEAPPRNGLCGVSFRAIIIGLIFTALIDLWLHYTELVLGANRGHTALSNTSIPFGAFTVFFVLVVLNRIVKRVFPSIRLTQAELLTIYVMCAVSTVMSSSGGIHFLMPTITAAHYFATDTNNWASLFHRYIPDWIAQKDTVALDAFYLGNAHVEIARWYRQVLAWSGFMFMFGCATLCLSMMLRKQWIEREHLPFPTVMLPIELAKEDTSLFRDPLFYLGAGVTFGIVWLNTFAWNFPSIPQINLRGIDLGPNIVSPPWNVLGSFKMTFFPFAIGIAYLLSTDVVFSVWFFYLFSRMEQVWGAAVGLTAQQGSAVQSSFPYLGHQGAGAFLGLALVSLWVSRRHLAEVFKSAFTFAAKPGPESNEHKWTVFGLIASVLGMITFAAKAGASTPVAAVFVLLVLIYLVAATRLRAETGNAWPVGPEIDAFRLMTTASGTRALSGSDLTTFTYLRTATAGLDMRGTCMPHQFDGLKVADSARIKPGSMARVMALAVGFGVVVSMLIALYVWTRYGALAKTNFWRSMSGQRNFGFLENWFRNPTKPDVGGMGGVAAGLGFTMFLAYCRTRWAGWPFHPVGYAMSNTFAASASFWMPCFIAWLAKMIIIRSGGMKLYRKMMPLFFGFIVGDLLGGGTTDLLGCLTTWNVYPVNW